jgi:thymidylate synthase (FAD)
MTGLTVELVAYTTVSDDMEELVERDEEATDAEYVAEIAGRECYQSQDKPNPSTALIADYMTNILKQEHYSVIEHANVTLRLTGVSRALTHELVRHRHFSFSQLSQRFVDMAESDYVIHPDISAISDTDLRERATDILESVWETCLEAYGELKEIFELDAEKQERTAKRKVKYQSARMVLPNMTETKIVVTGNLRTWREFLLKRLQPGADSEIRAMAEVCLVELQGIAPNIFEGL